MRRKPQLISTSGNDAATILQQLEPEVDYDGGDGFSGKLMLDTASLNTEVEGYTTKTYTLTDTLTLVGLSNNDSSNVPKTTTKSGVTLTLQSIDWQTHTADAIDYSSIPTSYTAEAYYSGSYTKNVPTGYISTVTYSGEVSKTRIEKVVYTLSYLGEEIPEPEPEPEPVVEDEPQSVEGKVTKQRLKEFNPLVTLRYSATHKTDSIYNTIYHLDVLEAYNKRLVKKIAVKGISVSGSTSCSLRILRCCLCFSSMRLQNISSTMMQETTKAASMPRFLRKNTAPSQTICSYSLKIRRSIRGISKA